jgi:hypothetical protein
MTVMVLGTVRSSSAWTTGKNVAGRKGLLRPGFGREVCWAFFDLERNDIELLLLWEIHGAQLLRRPPEGKSEPSCFSWFTDNGTLRKTPREFS